MYLEKLTATFLLIDTVEPIAKPIIKPTTKYKE